MPASLTFDSGDTEKSFTFTATADDVDDDGESVVLRFGSLPTGISAGTNSQAIVSITADDVPAVTVSFEQSSYTVAESDDPDTPGVEESKVTVKVSLSADPERTVEIPVLKLGLDGAGSEDYSGVPESLTFDSGDTEMSFTFTALHDTVDDDGEAVRLDFGTLPTGVMAVTSSHAIVSISDDDDPQVTLMFDAATYTVPEDGSVAATVLLSADPEQTVTIRLTETLMNEISDGDYDGVPANVDFAGGQTEATFTVTASMDEEDDGGESIGIGFGELPVGVTTADPSTTSVAIADGNVPDVTVKIEASSQTVAEGESVTVTITLDQAPERPVAISHAGECRSHGR